MTDHPAIPPASSLFSPIAGPRGLRLPLVFGNEAPQGRCPFYEHQCAHCDIGAGEGQQFTFDLNRERLAFFQQHYHDVLAQVDHLIIYNSGSTLNPREMSDATLDHILAYARGHTHCRRFSFDSREKFITADRLQFLRQRLRPDQTLCLTLGLESQSDDIRCNKLAKSMSREQIEQVFTLVSQVPGPTAFEINIVFQPPGVIGRTAVQEAVATVEFGLNLVQRFGVGVDFNYHPYYPSFRGLTEFPEHPRAILEDGIRALLIIHRLVKTTGRDVKIFVGWNDEGHDQESIILKNKLDIYQANLRRFNQTQDERDLRI